MNTSIVIPYCGTAPSPGELWSRWNLDPILLLALLALLLLLSRAVRPRAHRQPDGTAWYWSLSGWLALTLGLIAPICSLSVALFSARVAQHMWLVIVAAPLLALGIQPRTSEAARRNIHLLRTPAVASGLFAAMLWTWHLPAAYSGTFVSDLIYWLMHITLTGSAVLLWSSLLDTRTDNVVARLAAAFVTLLQMGLLGAIITLAPRLLYSEHVASAPAWSLTPLEDQQIGGLIMWVPGGVAMTGIVLLLLLRLIRTDSPSVRASQANPGARVPPESVP